jgi:hypothetical protein
VCISVSDDDEGAGDFWDHEHEEDWDNVHLIADSCDEFLAGLI